MSEKLTDKQRALVEHYVACGDVQVASAAADYAYSTSGYHALKKPHVQAEVRRLQQHRLTNELLPLAVELHKRLLTDPEIPANAQVQAVKLAYDRTLGDKDSGDGKSPDSMTSAELAAELDKIKLRRSELAKIVDAEVLEEQPTGGALD